METGQVLGAYRLIEPLGEGGFGKVWKALDLRLERTVALKVLKAADPEHHRQLLQEARTASQLHHPNVATIFEVGEAEGQPFLAMECVEGASLRAHMDRPMEGELLRRVAGQALAALHAAHQRGIVHRDIKPENLLLTPQGDLKILDFGVARRHHAFADDTHHALTRTEETGTGFATGTPAYMSPEQALGEAVGPAGDQFSLGLVLWELAVGRHPFKRGAVFETLHALTNDQTPSLARERPDLPFPMVEGIHRMLAKLPGDRFPDEKAAALAMDLDSGSHRFAWVADAKASAPARGRGRRGRLAVLGIALLAGLGVTSAWMWRATRPKPLAGRKGDLARPIRILILPLAGGGKGAEAWVPASLGIALTDAFRGRSDVLPYGRGAWMPEITGGEDTAPEALAQLARRAGADLVLHGSLDQVADDFRLRLRALKPEGGGSTEVFQARFGLATLLDTEARLRSRLPGLLGLPGTGPRMKGARRLETQEAFARASLLAGYSQESVHVALPILRKALEGEPDFAPIHFVLSDVLNNLANEAAVTGRPEEVKARLAEARREADLALQLDPGRADTYILQGNLYLREGDLESAERAALQAQKLEPAQANAYLLLATIAARHPGPAHFLRAVDHAQKAVRLRPDDPGTHYRLGQILTDAGQFQAALPHLDQALVLSPTMDYAHLLKSNALLWSGQVQAAEAALQAGAKAAPGFRLLKRNLAYAAYLRKDGPELKERLRNCASLWPEGHSTRAFLEGLQEAFEGQWGRVRARYGAQLKAAQARIPALPYAERTSLSLDLYQMGRVLAQGPDRQAAKPFIELSGQVFTNRDRMALRDPAFEGLWPAPAPWPGEYGR